MGKDVLAVDRYSGARGWEKRIPQIANDQFLLVRKLRLGTLLCETPFRGVDQTGNGVSRERVPKRSLGTRRQLQIAS
jgi:hypothetical protein